MPIAIGLLIFAGLIVLFVFYKDVGIDRDLLEAVRGDREQAKRLLKQLKLRYPGRSTDWYIDKALYDLGRDHGVTKRRSRGIKLNRRDFNWQNFFLLSMIGTVVSFLTSFISRWFH